MKIKTIISAAIIALILGVFSMQTFAYTIPEEYIPINAPFTELSYPEYEELTGESPQGVTILILQVIAGALLYFAAPLAIILIGLGAFNMVMGGADTEKVEQSKKQLTWVIIGLILIILSYSLVRLIITVAFTAGTPPEETAFIPQAAEIEHHLSLQHYLS